MGNPTIQTFGKYQILERVATGVTAEIYKARLEGIGGFQRSFAIKRILPALSRDESYIAILVDEAKVAGLLSHANIVQIVDLGQVDGTWYIAMEYVHGRDLKAVLARTRQRGLRLPVPHCVFITIELLKGLEYAHQRRVMRKGRAFSLNIIHRDVNPSNLLLSFQGEVKLTDFANARASHKALQAMPLPHAGRFDYASPEQAAASDALDQRSDLFSVGVLLYEMLTGEHPFRGASDEQTVERLVASQYVPVREHNPEVPESLEQIVDMSLRVDRDARHPSATAFKEALDKFFHEAGFIFTHSSLSSYMEGLFPEAFSGPGTSPALVPVSDEGDVPVALARQLSDPSMLHAPLAPGGGPVDEDESDQETLIRRLPSGWDDEASPVPPPQFDEQPEAPAPAVVDRPLTGSLPSAALGHRPTTASGRRRPRAGITGVLLVSGLLAGVVLGAASAVLVGLMAGVRPLGHGTLLAEPHIEVVAPAGTEIRVDGVVVGPSAKVKPGEVHNVHVTLRSGQTWSQEVVLNRGEHSVIILSEPDLR